MLLLALVETTRLSDAIRLLLLGLLSVLKALCADNEERDTGNDDNDSDIMWSGIPAKWRSRPMYCVPSMSLRRRQDSSS